MPDDRLTPNEDVTLELSSREREALTKSLTVGVNDEYERALVQVVLKDLMGREEP
jgi:hypothetical protein